MSVTLTITNIKVIPSIDSDEGRGKNIQSEGISTFPGKNQTD